MPWDYLQNPVLQVRQRIAAQFLRDSERILEIGAFKTPITSFLLRAPQEVTVIDPLAEPLEEHEWNGHPCRIRHLAVTLDELELDAWKDRRFGLLFCGMDLNRQEDEPGTWLQTVCRFVFLVSRACPPVLEYPLQWKPSADLFHLILSLLQPRIAADIRLDLSQYAPDGEMADEIRSRFDRRMVVLADMEQVGHPAELRERAARILFGSEGSRFVLGTADRQWQKVEGGLELKTATRAHDKASVQLRAGSLSITTPPDAWNYSALLPLSKGVQGRLRQREQVPAVVEIQVSVDSGEMAFGLLHEDGKQISGERLVKAGGRHELRIFIPDLRRHAGLMCRNGQTGNTITTARLFDVSLSLPES